MERKIIQFRDGSLGRKFSPRPIYFHIGFGGLRFFVAFAFGFTSALAVEVVLYMHCQIHDPAVNRIFTLPLKAGESWSQPLRRETVFVSLLKSSSIHKANAREQLAGILFVPVKSERDAGEMQFRVRDTIFELSQ
jgi:hypothetical protein